MKQAKLVALILIKEFWAGKPLTLAVYVRSIEMELRPIIETSNIRQELGLGIRLDRLRSNICGC